MIRGLPRIRPVRLLRGIIGAAASLGSTDPAAAPARGRALAGARAGFPTCTGAGQFAWRTARLPIPEAVNVCSHVCTVVHIQDPHKMVTKTATTRNDVIHRILSVMARVVLVLSPDAWKR